MGCTVRSAALHSACCGAQRSWSDSRGAFRRLFDLLVGGRTADRHKVREALCPLDPEELVHAGVLEIDGDAVRATLTLAAHDGVIVAGDRHDATGRADLVQGLTAASRMLAALTMRDLVRAALDVGTGSGVQALLVARLAGRSQKAPPRRGLGLSAPPD